MGRFGVDWNCLPHARGGEQNKERGKAEGTDLDLETVRVQMGSPVLPSYRRAATVPGASAHPHFTLDLHPEQLMAMSSMLQVVKLRLSEGWCSRLHT